MKQCPKCGWNEEKRDRLTELQDMTNEFGGVTMTEHGRKMPAEDREERTQLEAEHIQHRDNCGDPPMVEAREENPAWKEGLSQAPDDALIAEMQRRKLTLPEKKAKNGQKSADADTKETNNTKEGQSRGRKDPDAGSSGKKVRTTTPTSDEGEKSVGTHSAGPRGVASTGEQKGGGDQADTKGDGQPHVKDTHPPQPVLGKFPARDEEGHPDPTMPDKKAVVLNAAREIDDKAPINERHPGQGDAPISGSGKEPTDSDQHGDPIEAKGNQRAADAKAAKGQGKR